MRFMPVLYRTSSLFLYDGRMHMQYMQRCLELAEKARGKTGVNPMVGAVLVRDGEIIAEGLHEEFGKAHAERQLLEKFDQKISSTDVFYVNLEPCCHTNKKTPPCAQLLVERGLKNIVIGMVDPNPAVSGKGIDFLRSQGVNVQIAFECTADCLRFNRGFASLMHKGKPWVTLKSACTTDGRHCKDDGSQLKITDALQDQWSHRNLRARHDAILVGSGTIISDNPRLTIRYMEEAPPLLRIILDPGLKIPFDAKVVTPGTIFVCAHDAEPSAVERLENSGVRVFHVQKKYDSFSWEGLWNVLTTPAGNFHGISSILVEGGKNTWKTFRTAHMVDEEVTLIGR